MIFGNKAHALDYLGISPRLDTALRFLATTDMNALEDGPVLLDGEDVRVQVRHIVTKSPEEGRLEAHKAFADIQHVLEGEETILVQFGDRGLCETEASPEKDIWFYEGETQPIRLEAGDFLIVFPDDVHAPAVCCGQPKQIRKAVFKVRLD